MEKNNRGFGLIIILAILALVAVVSIFFLKINKPEVSKYEEKQITSEMTAKPVSTDSSDTSIENELDETVIIEEDFSDL